MTWIYPTLHSTATLLHEASCACGPCQSASQLGWPSVYHTPLYPSRLHQTFSSPKLQGTMVARAYICSNTRCHVHDLETETWRSYSPSASYLAVWPHYIALLVSIIAIPLSSSLIHLPHHSLCHHCQVCFRPRFTFEPRSSTYGKIICLFRSVSSLDVRLLKREAGKILSAIKFR
jgi:hypothetical protein